MKYFSPKDITTRSFFKMILILTLGLAISSCAFMSNNKDEERVVKNRQADLYYTEGTRHLLDGSYHEALSHLLKAHDLRPNDSKILNNLGMAFFFRGRSDRAIEHIERAVIADPQNADAKVNLASIFYREKRYDEALRLYYEVLENLVYSHQYRTHYNIAFVHEAMGNMREALKNLELSIQENPNYCPALFKLGNIYFENRRFDQALKYFHEGSRGECHQHAAPLYYKGLTLFRLQRFDEASSTFEDVIQFFPSSEFSSAAQQEMRRVQVNLARLNQNNQSDLENLRSSQRSRHEERINRNNENRSENNSNRIHRSPQF